MSGSYQPRASETEPITAQWSPGYQPGRATPYPQPPQPPPRDDYHYYQPGAYYRPGAQRDDLWSPPVAGDDSGWGGWPPPGGYWTPQPPPPPARRPALIAVMVVVIVLLMVAAVGVAVAVGRALGTASSAASGSQNNGTSQTVPGATAGPGNSGNSGSGSTLDSAAIAAKINPAVVDVNTVLGYQNGRAAGTGIVISSSGLVLTNNHVIAGATSISVTEVTNGRTYKATVVGYDRTEDVAVIKMTSAAGLPTASIGDSGKVGVGDGVVAIGNAGGTGGTPAVVEGTVTALNRSITASDESTGSSEQLTGLIEVDANIQAGDSGGPLVNGSAQVIGIDTAASAGFHYQASGGTGYAIPIDQAMTIANQITGGQASTRVHIGATGFLGVSLRSGNGSAGGGAAITQILPGSPAEAAGLAEGDVITTLDGAAVDSANTLTQLLDSHHPADRVRLGWTDTNGRAHTATLTLMTGPVG
jgi:S1-C subfamily serine protease